MKAEKMAGKPGRPAYDEVYVTASFLHTSKGVVHHGEMVKLPRDEAAAYRKKGFVK